MAGDCFANSAIRRCCVDTGSSSDALAMFPSDGSTMKASPSLGRVLRVPFPCVSGTMGGSDFLTPLAPHFVAFAWQRSRSEEHTSELQSHLNLVCRLLLEKKNNLKDVASNR